MPVSPQAVANAFIEIAREEKMSLTNMQVQKLVFLAQGYALALIGSCLYENNIHAWQWGPVIPSLYKKLRKYGSGVVSETLEAPDSVVKDTSEFEIILGVWENYGKFTGGQLSAMTHKPGSPWDKQWKRKEFDPIPPEEIKEYYKRLAEV